MPFSREKTTDDKQNNSVRDEVKGKKFFDVKDFKDVILRDDLQIRDIAKKHGVDEVLIRSQLEKGIEIEKEHTTNEKIAEEIALDHLVEDPNYYTKLEKMEKNTKKNAKEWARSFNAVFLEPGIVSYEDSNDGVIFLSKETIDKCIDSFIGRPVVIDHKEVDPSTMESQAQGYISGVKYNPETGKYECEGVIFGDRAKDLIENNNFSVSSAYDVIEVGEGGIWHNIEYDEEITALEGNHLALVDNPRYEDSRIVLNSKGDLNMKFFKKNQKEEDEKKENVKNEDEETDKKKENAEEEEKEKYVEVDGKKIALSELVETYENQMEDQEEELLLNETDEIEINNESVSVKELIDNYKNCMTKKNEKEEDEKDKKENEEEEKEKEDEDKEEEKRIKENKKKEGVKYYRKLNNLKENAQEEKKIEISTLSSRIARGKEKYGSKGEK